MKLIDRMLLRSFFKAWAVCFASLVSLYIVIDLFGKIDEFLTASELTRRPMVEVIARFYSFQLVLIFDRLCSVIVLLAAMFTIAWMQRNNELLPLLSAGVSTRRVLRPVFIGTLVMLCLNLINRELVLPLVSDQVQRQAADPGGEKLKLVQGGYEPNGILISGQTAQRRDRRVNHFTCSIPERVAGTLVHIAAREAHYLPKSHKHPSGGWLLTQTSPAELSTQTWKEPVLEVIDPGKMFLFTERVDFDFVTRNRRWHEFASTWEIFQEMQRTEWGRMSATAVQLHQRLTLPLLTVILVVMGVSLILRDQSRNVFLNAGLCLVVAAVFYAACYVSRHLGEYEYVSPALAAWMPVLLFGPFGFTMMDAVHT